MPAHHKLVDHRLEKDVDKAAKVHTRKLNFTGRGPKGYKRSDERIREEVCEALLYSRDVDASGIAVEVKDACVYLRGEVDSRGTKRAAEDTVDGVSGVQDVVNELRFNRNEPIVGRRVEAPENELGTRLA